MAGPNPHESERDLPVNDVPVLPVSREVLARETVDPKLQEELSFLYGFTKRMASNRDILGYGVATGEDIVGLSITHIMKNDSAYDGVREALNQLDKELEAQNPNARSYNWFSVSNNFDETVNLLLHPELKSPPQSDAVKALDSMATAMGADDQQYILFVKFNE